MTADQSKEIASIIAEVRAPITINNAVNGETQLFTQPSEPVAGTQEGTTASPVHVDASVKESDSTAAPLKRKF